jgi:hypothetical protein
VDVARGGKPHGVSLDAWAACRDLVAPFIHRLVIRLSLPSSPMTSTIPRYGLAPPSEDDALSMLARVMGVERAAKVWVGARRAAGLRLHGPLTPDELLRVAEGLMGGEGCEPAVGTSLAVRVRSWILLNRQQHATRR